MQVVIGLGSNLGNRKENILKSLEKIKHSISKEHALFKKSNLIETSPLLPENAPEQWHSLHYLNTAVLLETDLNEDEVLDKVQEIEKELGRVRFKKWAPRIIDIDIICTDQKRITKPQLTIPHPEAHKRDFIAASLKELISDSYKNFNFDLKEWSNIENLFIQLQGKTELPSKSSRTQTKYNGVNISHLSETLSKNIPKIFGILNITPDSFSDGSETKSIEHFLNKAIALKNEGAEVIDIGAESTRPNAFKLNHENEWQRLKPALDSIRTNKELKNTPLSIDSYHQETILKALDYNIQYINDVTGFRDPKMIELAKKSSCRLIFMHSLSIPVVKGETLGGQNAKESDTIDIAEFDVIEYLKRWAKEKISELTSHGIAQDRLIFDPGIGFGKSQDQSWEILWRLEEFSDLGVEIFIGHSRKSFLNKLTDKPFCERDPETLKVSLNIYDQCDYLRVHNPKIHTEALKLDLKYQSTVHELESRGMMPKTAPSLTTTENALYKLDLNIDPQKVILIAGTNGKGSVAATLEVLLREAGFSTGLYTSPHLEDTRERIKINGSDISKEKFIENFEFLETNLKNSKLTHFETLTLMAALEFSKNDLDYMIFEVGLGGSWDATNAIPHSNAIITNVSKDHMHILGNSLEEIAENKFGIITPVKNRDFKVVIGPFSNELLKFIQEKRNKLDAQFGKNLHWFDCESFKYILSKTSAHPPKIKIGSQTHSISLLGARGAENTATAIKAFEVITGKGDIHTGALEKVIWPARMERLSFKNSPVSSFKAPFWISGDHNEKGIESLLEILESFEWKNIYVLAAAGAHKNIDSIFSPLLNLDNLKLVLTETPFKKIPINSYGDFLNHSMYSDPSFKKCLNWIRTQADSDDLILVTGSLYLCGEVKKFLSFP